MAVKQRIVAVSFSIFCILKYSNATIAPLDEEYTATLHQDFSIPWTFSNETDMKTIDWTYKSSSSATPTTIMSKVGTAAVTVFNNYSVEHDGNGGITLKSVTMDNAGIYFCTVDYKLSSGLSVVTGTATISVTGNSNGEQDEDLSVEEIIGISLGSIIGTALIVAGVFVVIKFVILPRIIKADI